MVLKVKNAETGQFEPLYVIKGEDGHSPVIDINESGNWTIDGVDTGWSAVSQINVDTQIEFTEAIELDNINSNESVSTIFGKIKKFFTDLGTLAFKNKVDYANDIVNKPSLLALGETETTAYRGDRGKVAYDHSQITNGTNPHATTFANIASKPTTVAGYGITDTYTKTEVDNKVASVYKYRGSVASYANLPTVNLIVGDVYNCIDTGANYGWTGTDWDNLGVIYGLATQSANGLMSSIDKTKLDGIAQGANNYVHPATHSADILTDGTTNKAYTAAEKTKLSSIATGAQVNNITDANADSLTKGEKTTLHKHSYNNLDDKPTIPDAQIQSDWNQTTNTAKDYIKNKPTIPTVSNDFTNDYKELLDRVSGFNSVSTLTSLPVTKQSIIASVSAATAISLAATLANGLLLHIKVYNTSGSAITQALPTTGLFESKKIDGTNKASISIPAGGNAEISIWAVNNKYIIKTDI